MPMTIGKLRELLAEYPEEMEVTCMNPVSQHEYAEYDIERAWANSIPTGTVFLQIYYRQTS
jgi:hypothetical protein